MEKIKFKKTAITDFVINCDYENDDINKKMSIEFIKRTLEKEIFIKDFNTIKKTIIVQEYDNSKGFEFPAFLFETNELFKQENSEQEQEEIISEFTIKDFRIDKKHVIAFMIWLMSLAIILKASQFTNANNLTTWPLQVQQKTTYQLNAEKQNENILKKAKEYEEQARLNILLKESINKVKKYDKENEILEQQQLILIK